MVTSKFRSHILIPFSAVAIAAMTACSGGGGGGVITPPPDNSGGGATGSASLSWQIPTENTDGSAVVDLSGFRVYQSSTSNTATLSSIATISNPSVSIYLVENLAAGTYYFSVTALSAQNTESDFSNLAQVTIN